MVSLLAVFRLVTHLPEKGWRWADGGIAKGMEGGGQGRGGGGMEGEGREGGGGVQCKDQCDDK